MMRESSTEMESMEKDEEGKTEAFPKLAKPKPRMLRPAVGEVGAEGEVSGGGGAVDGVDAGVGGEGSGPAVSVIEGLGGGGVVDEEFVGVVSADEGLGVVGVVGGVGSDETDPDGGGACEVGDFGLHVAGLAGDEVVVVQEATGGAGGVVVVRVGRWGRRG